MAKRVGRGKRNAGARPAKFNAHARRERTREPSVSAVAVYNYASDAGAGSCTFAGGDGAWRAALLGSVAALAMAAGMSRGASANGRPLL